MRFTWLVIRVSTWREKLSAPSAHTWPRLRPHGDGGHSPQRLDGRSSDANVGGVSGWGRGGRQDAARMGGAVNSGSLLGVRGGHGYWMTSLISNIAAIVISLLGLGYDSGAMGSRRGEMKLLPNWIWKEENRAVATFVGTAGAAIIAGGWAVFVYLSNGDTPQGKISPLHVTESEATPPVEMPNIPDADSGWVDGGSNPNAFCNPQLKAVQVKYPNFRITMQILPELHKSEYTPFKHDMYRYRCSFAASTK